MYTASDTQVINIEKEQKAMVSYIAQRWNGFEENDLQDFVKKAWDEAAQLTRHSFKPDYKVRQVLHDWRREREDVNKWNTVKPVEKIQIWQYDAIHQLTEQLNGDMELSELIRHEQDKTSSYSMAEDLRKKMKLTGISKIVPKNWIKDLKRYRAGDDIEETNTDEFNGMRPPYHHGFAGRADPAFVIYQHDRHQDKPVDILLMAIMIHAEMVTEQNNNAQFHLEIKRLKEKFSQPEYYSNIQRTIDIGSDNRFIQALLMLDPYQPLSEKEFNEALANTGKKEKKNNEEKGMSKTEFAKILSEKLRGAIEEPTPEEKEQKAIQAKKVVEFLDTFPLNVKVELPGSYKAPKDVLIDTNHELESMISFTQNHWDGSKEDIEKVITIGWQQSMEKTHNIFDKYGHTDIIKNWDEKKKKNKELKIEGYEWYLALSSLGNIVMDQWDYEKVVKSIIQEVKKEVEKPNLLMPIGWKKLAKGYSDYDGMEEYSKEQSQKDREEFKGVDSNSASASGYPGRIALPYVMYDDKCQGRKPLEVLVGAIVGHAFFVSQHNHGVEIAQGLKECSMIGDAIENRFFNALDAIRKDSEISPDKVLKILANHSPDLVVTGKMKLR
jgi:hypothetical protein